MSNQDVFNLTPLCLLEHLEKEFLEAIPVEILTIEDMEDAAKRLARLSNNYSYLVSLLAYAKIMTREAKRSGNKISHEDCVDKKEVIQNITDAVKQLYAATSRAVTIHMENNMELRMNTEGKIR